VDYCNAQFILIYFLDAEVFITTERPYEKQYRMLIRESIRPSVRLSAGGYGALQGEAYCQHTQQLVLY